MKIASQNEEMLRAAIEQFIDRESVDIERIAMETLEGHQRAIMGAMTVDEIFKDRKKFSQKVFDIASTDLFNMGIHIISYTLKDIKDEEQYMVSLGMARTSEVQRDARIGEAEANRDSQIEVAIAEEQRLAARLINDIEIERYKRDFELKKAIYDVEVEMARAEAELERATASRPPAPAAVPPSSGLVARIRGWFRRRPAPQPIEPLEPELSRADILRQLRQL